MSSAACTATPPPLRPCSSEPHEEPGGPATIVFNGDFHWLDVDPEDFRSISETVLAHHATKGNVEAELAAERRERGVRLRLPRLRRRRRRRPL